MVTTEQGVLFSSVNGPLICYLASPCSPFHHKSHCHSTTVTMEAILHRCCRMSVILVLLQQSHCGQQLLVIYFVSHMPSSVTTLCMQDGAKSSNLLWGRCVIIILILIIYPFCIWRNWGLEKLYDLPTGNTMRWQRQERNPELFTPKPLPCIIPPFCPLEPVPTRMFQLLTLVPKIFLFNRWYTLLQRKVCQPLLTICEMNSS